MKGEKVDHAPRYLLVALLSAAIVTGIIFFLSIINLHISRDFYRQREKFLYRILEYIATDVADSLSEPQKEELAKLSKDYTDFSRIDMAQGFERTSLFTLFRGSIYLSNALLAAFIANLLFDNNTSSIVAYPIIIVLVQYCIGIYYNKHYLAHYAQGTDTPSGARNY
ncbi:MAG: hypothetical protein PVH77_00625 [Phycisphaerales bacterium]